MRRLRWIRSTGGGAVGEDFGPLRGDCAAEPAQLGDDDLLDAVGARLGAGDRLWVVSLAAGVSAPSLIGRR